MKKSVNGWMVGGFNGETPTVEAARAAHRLGFDAIELCFGAGELTPAASAGELAALRAQIEAIGIEISSMATGSYWGFSLGSPDEAERAEAVAFTEAYLKAGHAFGVDAILVVPGTVDVAWDPARPVVPVKQVWDNATKSLRALLPLAEKLGVAIALENVWSKFLTGPFEYASFIDQFQSPYLKVYFDAGNCLINGYPEHWIEILGSRIARVHVKGFLRRDGGGTLNEFTGSLLDGSMNWSAVFAALKTAGYDRYITSEVIVSPNGMPDLELAGKVCGEMKQLIEQYCQGDADAA
jgi:hexulose-6-phosphate isomerase